jgi:hypothetical protein
MLQRYSHVRTRAKEPATTTHPKPALFRYTPQRNLAHPRATPALPLPRTITITPRSGRLYGAASPLERCIAALSATLDRYIDCHCADAVGFAGGPDNGRKPQPGGNPIKFLTLILAGVMTLGGEVHRSGPGLAGPPLAQKRGLRESEQSPT